MDSDETPRSPSHSPARSPSHAPASRPSATGGDSARDALDAPRDAQSAARDAWRAARTFEDLCACSARFVAGELRAFPGWNAAELDEESEGLRERLVRWNQRGFLTVASQPSSSHQHAFVAGFARPSSARRLARADGRDGVRVSTFGAGLDARPESFPVSFHGDTAHAFAGHDARADEWTCFEDHVEPAALDALRAAAWVVAWDTRRARAETLWDALEAAWTAR